MDRRLDAAEIGRRIASLPIEERRQALGLVQRIYGLRTGRASLPLFDYAPLVYPGYRWFKHTQILGEHLERVKTGEIKRLMVFKPPRHGKTLLTSQIFPGNYLSRYPSRWVGAMSYAASLVKVNSRNARALYQLGGGVLRRDSRSIFQWETTEGGGYWCAGTRGGKTGKGFHLGLIDDPVKGWKEAQSELIREEIQNTYDFDFYTRGMKDEEGGEEAIVLIMTRWHEHDLAGWLLDRELGDTPEGWHIIHLEAIRSSSPPVYPSTCTVAADWRDIGEALCEELRPLKKLWQTRGRNVMLFTSLYQQAPRPKAGILFKRHSFRVVAAAPAGLKWARIWDLGGSEGKGDYTAGSLCGMDEEGRFYIDLRPRGMIRGQWESGKRDQVVRAVAEQDGKKIPVLRELEGGSAGQDQKRAFTRLLRGFTVHILPLVKEGSKEERAEPLKSQVDVGNVYLICDVSTLEGRRAMERFLDEATAFPRGKNDDQVDAVSIGFNWLARRCEGISEELRLIVGR